jgi:hypothetical protein
VSTDGYATVVASDDRCAALGGGLADVRYAGTHQQQQPDATSCGAAR